MEKDAEGFVIVCNERNDGWKKQQPTLTINLYETGFSPAEKHWSRFKGGPQR